MYSITFSLLAYSRLYGFRLMRRAVIDKALQLLCFVPSVLRRAPNADDAEFAATTLVIVIWAKHLAPSVTATQFDAPSLRFGMLECGLDFLLWVRPTRHLNPQYAIQEAVVK
ncbi:hypothetical protein [Mesorhizobium atlanticum]|uniref:hypothetical protein n=1 Tax=Mesorhizobium atlanticum TaxID=2233532 RepID=UPI0015EC35E5|nr:hypothetical protein [Mesorhizobium atlanticum]